MGNRKYSSGGIIQLGVAGNRQPTLTPSAAVQSLTFNLSSLIASMRDMYRYATRIVVQISGTVTGGGGNVVNHDMFGKVVDSLRLYSPILGEMYSQARTAGVDVAGFDSWLGSGYKPTNIPRPQIAATNAQDYTFNHQWSIPLAFDVLANPYDTAPWVGLLEGGLLEVRLAAATCLGTDSASMVLKATPFAVTAWIEYVSSPDAIVHTPFVPNLIEWTTAGTQIKLQQVDAINGLKGIGSGDARLFAMGLYGNAQAVSGARGIADLSTITRISLPWRDQESIDVPEAILSHFLFHQIQGRSGYIQGGGAAALLGDAGRYPYDMGAVFTNTYLHQHLTFFPIVMPSMGQQISKLQKVRGDLTIDTGWSANPNGTHRARVITFRQFDDGMNKEIMGRMNRPASAGYVAVPKMDGGKPLSTIGGGNREAIISKTFAFPRKIHGGK
jgi:hypothetical protein